MGRKDPLSMRSGRYLASLLSVAEEVPSGAGTDDSSKAAMDPSVRSAALSEMDHEIIALGDRLIVNEANLEALKDGIEPDAPALVVSFLGDTSAGKSHTIRELMGTEESRPYCQDARSQKMATTFNVNLFSSTTMAPGMVVHLVDYEGENGSNTPVMMAARKLRLREDSKASRSEQVATHFPRLAYTTSDVIVMVAREPFYNRRYLDRCIQLAKRANSGVSNVQRPALVLVGNKLPGDEVVLDVDASTTAFFDCWGEDAQELDSFFSAILCLYIPHKSSVWTDPADPGRSLDGAAACAMQLGKLRNILAVLARRRRDGAALDPMHDAAADGEPSASAASAPSLSLSHRHGVWFGLLPRVVDALNAGRSIDVGGLLDEEWRSSMRARAAADEGVNDAFVALAAGLRPPMELSSTSEDLGRDVAERHRQHRRAAVAVTCRLLACRLRHIDRGLLVPDRVRAVVAEALAAVTAYLDSVAPCCAVYSAPRTTPVDRPGQPVYCLQQRGAHSTHRTHGLVRGGTGIWGAVASFVPFNDTWRGDFVPPPADPVDVDACADLVAALARLDDAPFLASLADVRSSLDGPAPLVRVGLARMLPPPGLTNVHLASLLLPPCPAVSGAEHERLAIVPGATASPHLPYCAGCGVKLAPPSESAAAASSASSRGILGALASLFGMGAKAGSGEPESPKEPAWSADEVAAAAATEAGDRPGAAGLIVAKDGDHEALDELLAALSGGDDASAVDGPDSGPPKHNIWLGLCPRCWQAAYAVPAGRGVDVATFVPLPAGQHTVFD